MATLLVNNIATASPIPLVSPENFGIHNPNGVEAILLKSCLINILRILFAKVIINAKLNGTS